MSSRSKQEELPQTIVAGATTFTRIQLPEKPQWAVYEAKDATGTAHRYRAKIDEKKGRPFFVNIDDKKLKGWRLPDVISGASINDGASVVTGVSENVSRMHSPSASFSVNASRRAAAGGASGESNTNSMQQSPVAPAPAFAGDGGVDGPDAGAFPSATGALLQPPPRSRRSSAAGSARTQSPAVADAPGSFLVDSAFGGLEGSALYPASFLADAVGPLGLSSSTGAHYRAFADPRMEPIPAALVSPLADEERKQRVQMEITEQHGRREIQHEHAAEGTRLREVETAIAVAFEELRLVGNIEAEDRSGIIFTERTAWLMLKRNHTSGLRDGVEQAQLAAHEADERSTVVATALSALNVLYESHLLESEDVAMRRRLADGPWGRRQRQLIAAVKEETAARTLIERAEAAEVAYLVGREARDLAFLLDHDDLSRTDRLIGAVSAVHREASLPTVLANDLIAQAVLNQRAIFFDFAITLGGIYNEFIRALWEKPTFFLSADLSAYNARHFERNHAIRERQAAPSASGGGIHGYGAHETTWFNEWPSAERDAGGGAARRQQHHHHTLQQSSGSGGGTRFYTKPFPARSEASPAQKVAFLAKAQSVARHRGGDQAPTSPHEFAVLVHMERRSRCPSGTLSTPPVNELTIHQLSASALTSDRSPATSPPPETPPTLTSLPDDDGGPQPPSAPSPIGPGHSISQQESRKPTPQPQPRQRPPVPSGVAAAGPSGSVGWDGSQAFDVAVMRNGTTALAANETAMSSSPAALTGGQVWGWVATSKSARAGILSASVRVTFDDLATAVVGVGTPQRGAFFGWRSDGQLTSTVDGAPAGGFPLPSGAGLDSGAPVRASVAGFATGAVITVIMDFNQAALRFLIDGVERGTAFQFGHTDDPEPLRVVALLPPGATAELVGT